MNVAKEKGTRAESAVVRYLRHTIFPDAERRTQTGKYDKGDINAHRDLVFEVKAVEHPSYPGLLRETETERVNAGATYGFLIHKPVSVGTTGLNAGRFLALMPVGAFQELVWEGQSALITHEVSRNARGLDIRKAIAESRELASLVNPVAFIMAITVKTNANLDDYVVVTLCDLITLLARAGYGTPVTTGEGS